MSDYSSFLFAEPGLVEGAGRILDLADTLTEYSTSRSAAQADEIANLADWLQTGRDLENAFSDFDRREHS